MLAECPQHLGFCMVDPNGTSFQEEITEEKRKLTEFFKSGPGQVCGVTSLYLQRFDKKRPEGEQAEFEHLFGTTVRGPQTKKFAGLNSSDRVGELVSSSL